MASSPNAFGPLRDATLMLLRVVTGAFLLHGTLDNVLRSERMQEFVVFLTQNGSPVPFMAQGGGRFSLDALLARRSGGRA